MLPQRNGFVDQQDGDAAADRIKPRAVVTSQPAIDREQHGLSGSVLQASRCDLPIHFCHDFCFRQMQTLVRVPDNTIS